MMKKRVVRAGLLLILLLGFILPVIAGEYTIFGPQRFERGAGKPVALSSTFASPVLGTDFTLRLSNGDDQGGGRVSSGTIALNGGAVVSPADFNQQVQGLERSVSLSAQNALSVDLASKSGSYLILSVVGIDNIPPLLTISAPRDNATTEAAFVDLLGTVSDATPLTLSVNGNPVVVNGGTFQRAAIPLLFGANTLRVTAVDLGGNSASTSVTVTRNDLTPPQLTITAPANGSTTELESIALTGTVFDLNAVTVTVNGLAATVVAESFSSPEVPLSVGDNPLNVVATDSWGNATKAVVIVTRKALRPPVELQPAGTFGAQYQDLIPADTKKTSYDPKRFSLITGEVKGIDNQPISGVIVSVGAGSCVECHGQEYGTVKTNAEGRFTLPVEGGATMTVTYNKPGLIPSHRQVYVPWNGYAVTETVQMLAEDSAATTIAFDGNPATVMTHRSTPVIDTFGQRSATLVFSGDNQAYEVDAGGNIIRELSSITTRATEFVTPESMPANLPPTSAYTYCAEFSVDGVQRVKFTKPVIGWVDNFLGFDVGEIVPVGYYDRDRGVWVPSDNGRVVRLLDTDGNGSVDALDSDGDNFPDDLNSDGSFRDEVKGLEDPSRYQFGATFWRFSVTHFTPWDANWPYGAPPDAIPPNPEGEPEVDQQASEEEQPCGRSDINSFVEDRSRIFHEDIPVPGTDMTLHYASNRVKGYNTRISVPVSGATVPASLKGILVKVEVAGRIFNQILPPRPNQQCEFTWDGLDGMDRPTAGSIIVQISIGFIYNAIYYSAGDFPQAFANFGTIPESGMTSDAARMETISWRRVERFLTAGANGNGLLVDGWTISEQHYLTPDLGTIIKGNGEKISKSFSVIEEVIPRYISVELFDGQSYDLSLYQPSAMAFDNSGNMYFAARSLPAEVIKVDGHGRKTVVAGNPRGTYYAVSGLPATQVGFKSIMGISFDSSGNMLVADCLAHRLGKVSPDGIFTIIAGLSSGFKTVSGFSGDGGLATNALLACPSDVAVDMFDNIYISDAWNHRIRKIDQNGIITTVAGQGQAGFSGDGGPAINAELNSPSAVAVDRNGNIYFADYSNNRVRKIDITGIITTVAGSGDWYWRNWYGDGGPATAAFLREPSDVLVDNSGNLYIGSMARIRLVDTNGIIKTIAGKNLSYSGPTGDGGPAVEARLNGWQIGRDPSGILYILDEESIRKVGLPSIPATNKESYALPFIESGNTHFFTSTGQHQKTVDLSTGVALQSFGYDTNNNLITLADQFGRITNINRDANGVPTSITAPDGQATQLTIDADNKLTAVTYPDDKDYTFEYTSGGLMTFEKDPNGNRFEHRYDSGGKLTDVLDPEGGHWIYDRSEYSTGAIQVQKTTGEGNTTTYLDRTDSTGAYTTTITGPSGGVTNFTRSADSLTETSASTCGMNQVSKYGLDTEYKTKFVKEQTESTPSGKKRLTLRDKIYSDTNGDKIPDQITSKITVNGKITTLLQDVFLAKKEATSPLGRKVTSFYDPANLLTKSLSVAGLLDVTYAYDARGRPTVIGQGERQTTFAYNDQGFLASVTDPEQRTTSYDTDVMGRVTAIHRPDLSSIGFEYDHNGNMTVLDNPSSVAHAFDYNGNDARTGYSTPQSGNYRYTYNKDRRLTETLFPSGRSLVNLYDKDRLAKVITPEGDITLNYLCASKLGSMSKGGETLTYTYDGKLVTAETATGTLSQSLGYTYNNDFNVTGFTYAGATANFTYDNDGLLTGSGSFTISRDAANGLPKTVSGGNYSLTRSFSGYGEVAGETTTIGGINRFAYSLNRSPAGRIAAKNETIGGTAINYAYSYDDLGRLTSVTKDNAVVEEYRYDGVGRRSYEMNAARGVDGRSFAYSDEDHLLTAGDTAYQYDLDGFLTSKTDSTGITAYTYSSRGELLKVVLPESKIVEYVHDPQGRRIAKKVNGVIVEKYLWQGLTRLLAVYNGSNALVMRFQYADGRMPVGMTKGAVTYHLGYDQVGSLRLVIDSAGNTVKEIGYDSFGNILTDSNPTFTIPFGFAGGLHDRDINLVRFGFRDYDPETGRWTAKDPIGFSGGDVDLWGYVQSDPINFIDTTGQYGNKIVKLSKKLWGKVMPAKLESGKRARVKVYGDESAKNYKGKIFDDGEIDPPNAKFPKDAIDVAKDLLNGSLIFAVELLDPFDAEAVSDVDDEELIRMYNEKNKCE